MAPLGLGGDGLGSLRWPAQCCGITALKPTLGRIPAAGEMTIGEQLLVVDGPLARRVADLRAAFAVLAGPDWRDPRTVPAPLPDPVRVAAVAGPGGHGTAPPVQAAVRTAATLAFYTGATLYYLVFYRSRLIPRWLSAWGLAGTLLGLAAGLLVLFQSIAVLPSTQVVLNLPIATQEMVLAVWLIVKGFSPTAKAPAPAELQPA